MKRFVIHVEGSDRIHNLKKEMNSQYGNQWNIFNAIVNKEQPSKGISDSFKQIVKDNYNEPMIHILEDDVKFVSRISREVFEENLKVIPEDWGIYSGCSYTHIVDYDHGNYKKISDWRSMINCVIRKSAYDYILSHDHNTSNNIDHWLSMCPINVYLCNPMVSVQYDGYSYNKKSVVDYSHYLRDKNILA